tara:strand:+ start:1096 stop:1284 length:189 start_codon:yes stop_codon:yes gene_type:complete
MWIAVVLACSTQMATSCQVFANTKEMFYEESTCNDDAMKMSSYLVIQGVVAVPICFEVGKSA